MIRELFSLPYEGSLFWVWIAVAAVLLVSLIIQLIYFFRYYLKVPKFKKLNEKSDTDGVSVIICVKNQADLLKKNLPVILNQIYPKFEVIVVDDGSTDDTEDVLNEFKRSYNHLYTTGIEGKRGYVSGKKVAQTIGIKAAKFNQLLFTNPECEPLSPLWIRHMQSNFLQKTEIVIGYGAFKARKGLLNKWIRTDSVYMAMKYLGYGIKGLPFMGVGNNLAYRKDMFFNKKGFASHLHIPAGADLLFVNQNSNHFNTAIEIHPDSFTVAEPITKWKSWLRHKRTELLAVKKFKKKHKRILRTELASRALLWLSAAILLSFWIIPGVAIIALIIRETCFMIVFKLGMKRLKEKNLLVHSLVYDKVWPVFSGFLKFRNRFTSKTPKWK